MAIQRFPAGLVRGNHQWRREAAVEGRPVIQHRGMATSLTAQQVDRRVVPWRTPAVKKKLLAPSGDLCPKEPGTFREP